MVTSRQPLPRAFYARPVLSVARDCIGKHLIHETDAGWVAGRIVEVEAYRGPEDRAAHSYGGRRTARTEVMYGPPGHAYVFFVYGMHWNFNVVTSDVGAPHVVLIRAVEPIAGRDIMAARRKLPPMHRDLTNGPGKVCRAFAIDGAAYGRDLTAGSLFLSDGQRSKVARSPRIGIDYAGEWALRPWRFYDPESACVSRARPGPRTTSAPT